MKIFSRVKGGDYGHLIFVALILLPCCSLSACPTERVRKPWDSLTRSEQNLFKIATGLLKENGVWDKLAKVYGDSVNFDRFHGNSLFLPWHRWYLWVVEGVIRDLGPEFECFTLPYWDWEKMNGNLSLSLPVLNHLDFGSIDTSHPGVETCMTDSYYANWKTIGGICYSRTYDSSISVASEALLAQILSLKNYGKGSDGFRARIEGIPHSSIHEFLGGTMSTSFAPYDPIFLLHHANIDRFFALWQDCWDYDKIPLRSLPIEAYEATGSGDGLDSLMPYYYGTSFLKYFTAGITPRIVYHIQKNDLYPEFSYSYQDPFFPPLLKRFVDCKWDWFSSSTPSTPTKDVTPKCGNQITELTEECDSLDRCICTEDCRFTSYSCGNGIIEPECSELCDDRTGILGASISCWYCGIWCGDGVVDPGEQCDDGNREPCDGCNPQCSFERCGDGVIQSCFGETCDEGNSAGSSTCNQYCRNPGYCGNFIIESGEECDDGNTVTGDGCSSDCYLENLRRNVEENMAETEIEMESVITLPTEENWEMKGIKEASTKRKNSRPKGEFSDFRIEFAAQAISSKFHELQGNDLLFLIAQHECNLYSQHKFASSRWISTTNMGQYPEVFEPFCKLN